MGVEPFACSMVVLTMLFTIWGMMREKVSRVDHALAYHVGLYQRDRRRARFYFWSVWLALLVTFASLFCISQMAELTSPQPQWQRYVLGGLYGVGLWGLSVVALIWLAIGKRASELTFDTQSPVPIKMELPLQKKDKRNA